MMIRTFLKEEERLIVDGVGSFSDLILRSIFFRSFANVATFFNVAGTKLGFRTFAKVFDRKQQF